MDEVRLPWYVRILQIMESYSLFNTTLDKDRNRQINDFSC